MSSRSLATAALLIATACVSLSEHPDRAGPSEPAATVQDPAPAPQDAAPAFGGEKDVDFARRLWTQIRDYRDWRMQSELYEGREPHGAWLRIQASWANLDDRAHPVLVKDNFVGEEEAVKDDPGEHLGAITVMVQREADYAPDHGNWFFVKYGPDGKILESADGKPLAGLVASCVECHDTAAGHDYLFHNDG